MEETAKPTGVESELLRLRKENSQLRRELERRPANQTELDPEVLATLAGLPIVLWAIDVDGIITISRGRGLAALGFQAGELVGMNVFDMYEDPDVLDPIRRSLLGEKAYNLVEIGGGWWENRYFPQFVDGRVISVYALSLDVSPQHEAELARRRSEEHWRSLVENAPDFIGIIDRDHKLVFANRAEGYDSTHEVVGRPVDDFVASEDRDVVRRAVDATFEGETGLGYETNVVSPSGEQRWFEARLAPIQEDGKVTEVIVVATNITARHQAAIEKQQLEAQVQHAQKLESLGVLAGGIAHDFNNLLVGIMGHAELASLQLGDDPVNSHVEGIVSAASRASSLCEQMLSYAGRGRLELVEVNLSRLAEEMYQLLHVTLDAGISIDQQLQESIWPIEGDATQLQQVTMNLITNAGDALAGRTGRISLRTGSGFFGEDLLAAYDLIQPIPPGEYSFVEVADGGSGMDEETRLKMFDPFYTTKTSGRGLGMAAVLGIVARHDGAISVRSSPGRGTTVRVFFPRADGVEARPVEARRPEARSLSHQAMGGGRTVLLVDDDPSVRAVARRMLEILGFQTLVAENGQEALDLYEEHSPAISLVLLDLTMPVMGGLEAAGHIFELDPDARVLFTSGYQKDASQVPDAAGMLAKPYRLAELRDKLSTILEDE